MVKYEHHSHGTFDVGEISQFTYKAYSSLPIPYKYGNSLESICMWFKDKRDCPDFLSIAREDGKIRGWTGVYHWTDSMAYYLAWHPLVYPVDIEVGTCLVQDCIEYTKSTGRERMEVFLMNLTDEYRDYAVTCGEMYEAANMKRGYEWTFMNADLTKLDFTLREIPDSMYIKSLIEVSNEQLWPDYDNAFSSGGDRRYLTQSESQRREQFNSFFSREVPMEARAHTKSSSLVQIYCMQCNKKIGLVFE